MKKLLLGLALAGVASANATVLTFSDKDVIFADLNSGTPSYSGTFEIDVYDGDGPDGSGYNPLAPNYSLYSATVGFNFTTGANQSYDLEFELGDGPEGFSGSALGTTFAVGGAVGAIAFGDLAADGQLGYTVTWLSGPGFTLDTASLVATAVPDGGSTVMLLGSTLMGMAALARRKK